MEAHQISRFVKIQSWLRSRPLLLEETTHDNSRKLPPNKAVEAMEMHKVPPTWLELDMICGP